MTLLPNGEDDDRPKLATRLSNALFGAETPKSWDPDEVLPVGQRRPVMRSIDAMEIKWSKAALALTVALAIFLPIYAKTELHSAKDKAVSTTSDAVLLAGLSLVFAILGLIGLRLRRRTIVAFSFFIIGLSFTYTYGLLALPFLVVGGWLMLRAYRIQKYGTPNARTIAKQGAVRTTRAERKAANSGAAPAKKPVVHKPATANKRYTPKAPPRKKVPKAAE
jgi:hypothetical protein